MEFDEIWRFLMFPSLEDFIFCCKIFQIELLLQLLY